MRRTASITSISWIPSEAVEGLARLPFGSGVAHYDVPPPDQLDLASGELDALRDADRFRFANRLEAWIDVDDDGTITAAGYTGGGVLGSTTLTFGRGVTVPAMALPDLQAEPEFTEGAGGSGGAGGSVRFLQTCGGRTGVPAPRTVRRPPFVQYRAPIAWTTLALTIHADGTAEGSLVGASPFPRHWVYDGEGRLVAKSGLIDFRRWYQHAFGGHTPWGDLDEPTRVTAVESPIERDLSRSIMGGTERTTVRRVAAGCELIRQGDVGDEVFVLLDGVLGLEIDGREVAELGPGVVVGERAGLECGRRTSTLRTLTECKVAVASADRVDRAALARLASEHRRESPFGGEG